ncbi:MAG: hypothetical protein M1837_002730 [Sclerophora amabilis]|nr:MAG: hypothetical protein M1837_002730 [Sclerophora amabilis]
MDLDQTLLCGVEIEILLKFKSDRLQLAKAHGYGEPESLFENNTNRKAVRHLLARVLSDNEVETTVEEHGKGQFSTWTVTDDPSIHMAFPHDGYYGVEIVSPTLKSNQNWQRDIEHVWEVLKEYFEVKCHTSCGTHVHVSPGGRFSLGGLKRAAKAAILYEPAVRSLVLERRRTSVDPSPASQTQAYTLTELNTRTTTTFSSGSTLTPTKRLYAAT